MVVCTKLGDAVGEPFPRRSNPPPSRSTPRLAVNDSGYHVIRMPASPEKIDPSLIGGFGRSMSSRSRRPPTLHGPPSALESGRTLSARSRRAPKYGSMSVADHRQNLDTDA